MASNAAWHRLDAVLAAEDAPPSFSIARLAAAPDPVRRYFEAAIAPGTPLAAGARLSMRGRIKLGRWLPFRARQLLAPHHGTVWAARVAWVITGSDSFVEGRGSMDWNLLGIIRVVHAEGDDVSRSAAGRVAAESIWVPTALVPPGANWSASDDHHIGVDIAVGDELVRLDHHLDDDGHIRSSRLLRWGDPDNAGTFKPVPFGVEVTASRTFGGVTIPSAGRAGWHIGTSAWDEGEFFRFEITSYERGGGGEPTVAGSPTKDG